MSATLAAPRLASRLTAPLQTTLAAGGWTNALILLGMGIGPLLALATDDRGKSAVIGLALASIFTMFWAMLAGARLVALFLSSVRLRMPGIGRQALLCGMVALVLAVLLPAQVQARAMPVDFALAAAVLGTATALGLFWASMPPWLMWVLIAVGATARGASGKVDWVALRTWLASPTVVASAGLIVLAASALCWGWMATRRQPSGPWSTPMAQAMANSVRGTLELAQQANQNSPLLALETPVGSALRREPQQALAIALGPGFGRTTLRNLLATQAPIVAVALFWLLLGTATDGKTHIGLAFAPMMVLSTAFAPSIRLQTLFWRPALGLHELALLPGLPRRPARSLAAQLGRQMILRALPALTVMACFGLAVGAPRPYYHLLLWNAAASLFLLAGSSLLSLQSRPARWAAGALMLLITVAAVVTMLPVLRSSPAPSWLLPAWSAAAIAGAVLYGIAMRRLQARPHPWLQN